MVSDGHHDTSEESVTERLHTEGATKPTTIGVGLYNDADAAGGRSGLEAAGS